MTQKVLKSCRSKIATWAHDVYYVHEASLYIETCWQSSFIMHIYNRVFPTGGMGSPPLTSQRSAHAPTTNFLFSSHQKSISQPPPLKKIYNPIKTSFLAVVTPCTIFVLISYSFDTQVMLILFLIDVQYSQNAVSSFEKGSKHENHSRSSVYYFTTL